MIDHPANDPQAVLEAIACAKTTATPQRTLIESAYNWVVWSCRHNAYILSDSDGFTADINRAGLHSFDEARQLCKDANADTREPQLTMLPK